MTELEQNRIFDISYEMRGLAATLVAASRGDIQDPERESSNSPQAKLTALPEILSIASRITTPKRPHKDRPVPDIQ